MSTNARKPIRQRMWTRIDQQAAKLIEEMAEQRRTTTAQVMRVLLEDAVRAACAKPTRRANRGVERNETS